MKPRQAPVLLVAAALFVALLPGTSRAQPAQPAFEVHRVDEARFDPRPGEPFFVLVVGNDNRPGVEGERGDAIHVVGVNPAASTATILNIPRDTYVPIPGRRRDKITHAFLYGGPRLMAETVSLLVGVPITFVVSTNFAGFKAMVDDLGGVDVHVPFAMNDRNSGAVFDAGPRHMDGAAALAFARNRYIPDGDIRRSEHQGLLMLAALAKVRAEATTPVDTVRFLGVLMRHGRLDGIGVRDLYRMARLAQSIDPGSVRNVTMPARVGTAGRASVVHPTGAAPGLFADFRDDALLQAH